MGEAPSDKGQLPEPRLWQLWPHLRALLIFFHLFAVLCNSTPRGSQLLNKEKWKHPHSQRELGAWAVQLSRVGIEVTQDEFESFLWGVAESWSKLRDSAAEPSGAYVKHTGARQGWTMFLSPQRRPGRLSVEVEESGVFRLVYQSRSGEYTWRRHQFDHNRFRKYIGRLYRPTHANLYEDLAAWLARRAAQDFPSATRLRVFQERRSTHPPGQPHTPGYQERAHERVLDLEPLR